ncbi:MAG: hypothetical protein MUP52_11930 [Candidatus Aminicenantes bacterium]|nr:hypothetical protein [Candidatus Aminicenantes bacterium]
MNCTLERMGAKMSAFELGLWNWYCETVNHFTLEVGIVADELRRTGFRGPARKMALSALNSIHLMFQTVAAERRNKAQEQMNG